VEWFGVDPKKSGRVLALGKDMNPKKFATAAAFAEALVKAVDAEFPAPKVPGAGDDTNEDGDDANEDDDTGDKEKPAARRRSDGPGENDANQRSAARSKSSGPWVKLTDAPADVQKEIKRTADRFVPTNAPKETREKYISKELESHYSAQQIKKGKK